MKWLFIFLPFFVSAQMEVDKKLHFLAGATISNITYASLEKNDLKPFTRFAISFGAGVFIGASKETYDYLHHGKWDVKDFLATSLGSFTVILPLTIKMK